MRPSTIGSKPSHRIEELDGLRGIAILMVLADHLFLFGPFSHSNHLSGKSQEIFQSLGQRGVQLFFVLSAFTIMLTSTRRLGQELRPKLNFYLRRWFRIMPLWIVSILLYAWYRNDFDAWKIFMNVSFLFGFIRYQSIEYFSPAWSLFVEESFYLLFPWFLATFQETRKVIWITLGTYLMGYLWIRIAPLVGVPMDNFFLTFFPAYHWYSFAVGILFFHLWSDRQKMKLISDNQTFVYMITALSIIQFFRREHELGIIAIAMILTSALVENGWFARLCRTRILRSFGESCYSIYLLHMLVLPNLPRFQFLEKFPADLQWGMWFAPFSAICLLAGHLVYQLFEAPTIHYGQRLINALEFLHGRRAELDRLPI